jgi:signal peptidase II
MVGAAWGRVLAVALLVIAADQASKAWVRATVGRTERDGVFPGVELVNVRNRGVAFGLLSGGRGLVLALTAVALLALLVYFARHPGRPGLWLATGLLVGGAAGNLVDRLRGDAVTDFIDLPLWPPFNVADACVTLGVLALLWVIEGRRGEASAAGVGDEGDPRLA